MYDFTLEVCVDSVESAIAAQAGGADRVELCGNLIIGGTTPSPHLFKLVKREIQIPVHVLIRPRFGDFLYSDYEIEEMKDNVRCFAELGADGIVIGALTSEGQIQKAAMKEMIAIARSVNPDITITLHRAFDMCRDPYVAYEDAKELGMDLILTSGQKGSALEGKEVLSSLVMLSGQQKDRKNPVIMAGGGVRGPEDVKKLYELGIRTYHMSGKKTYESQMIYRNPDVSMGLPVASEYSLWKTDADLIQNVTKLREK